ncbi:hypothetical protein WNY77_21340 [Paraglaciecola mesophila]|mgnify:CR=1 FL=1|uniref:Uncharacterized protein n=1 Tax=Paraglaciecola mesophila TaxID=197222 RepID=A0ABU9T2L7_9ALTE
MDEQDALKMEFDYCKHIATISAGAILVVVTFSEKFTKNDFSYTAATAVFLFVVAIIGTIQVQMDIVDERKLKPVTKFKQFGRRLTLFGFIGGFIALLFNAFSAIAT